MREDDMNRMSPVTVGLCHIEGFNKQTYMCLVPSLNSVLLKRSRELEPKNTYVSTREIT